MKRLAELGRKARSEVAAAGDPDALRELELRYLGRRGELTLILRSLGDLSPEERPAAGQQSNQLRRELTELIGARAQEMRALPESKSEATDRLDVTLPGTLPSPGRAHPLMRVWQEVEDIFLGMGFDVVEGNEIETDYFNFEALNVPRDHPARDMQDSFYVSRDIVLRTQTSPVQIRMMRQMAPKLPVRLVHAGRVFRRDDDITHSPMFHQVEGLLVDRGIGLQHLKGVLLEFARRFYGAETQVRMRPSYFPFTEPSAEVDVTCAWCRGKGCRVCKGTGWVEILGAGMVHPNVLRHGGYDPEQVTGFAFGMGLDRQAQLRFEIDNVRLLFVNDWRLLGQV
ncbi:MAG: phenylalanine--tRNA ligase subunit alpha [Bacillota bacterium]|nr:phenylalanine--tRNA ligase subunit alpha [Bacillota bacterium]